MCRVPRQSNYLLETGKQDGEGYGIMGELNIPRSEIYIGEVEGEGEDDVEDEGEE